MLEEVTSPCGALIENRPWDSSSSTIWTWYSTSAELHPDRYFSIPTPKTDLRLDHPKRPHIFRGTDIYKSEWNDGYWRLSSEALDYPIIVAWPIIYSHVGHVLISDGRGEGSFLDISSSIYIKFVKGSDISQPLVFVDIWQLMEKNGRRRSNSLAWKGLLLVQLNRVKHSICE